MVLLSFLVISFFQLFTDFLMILIKCLQLLVNLLVGPFISVELLLQFFIEAHNLFCKLLVEDNVVFAECSYNLALFIGRL